MSAESTLIGETFKWTACLLGLIGSALFVVSFGYLVIGEWKDAALMAWSGLGIYAAIMVAALIVELRA